MQEAKVANRKLFARTGGTLGEAVVMYTLGVKNGRASGFLLMSRLVLLLLAVVFLQPLPVTAADNVIFITWDGFRWQELFGGAEEALISKADGGVPEVSALRDAFWR